MYVPTVYHTPAVWVSLIFHEGGPDCANTTEDRITPIFSGKNVLQRTLVCRQIGIFLLDTATLQSSRPRASWSWSVRWATTAFTSHSDAQAQPFLFTILPPPGTLLSLLRIYMSKLTISARRAEPVTSLVLSLTIAILSSASKPLSGFATADMVKARRTHDKQVR